MEVVRNRRMRFEGISCDGSIFERQAGYYMKLKKHQSLETSYNAVSIYGTLMCFDRADLVTLIEGAFVEGYKSEEE